MHLPLCKPTIQILKPQKLKIHLGLVMFKWTQTAIKTAIWEMLQPSKCQSKQCNCTRNLPRFGLRTRWWSCQVNTSQTTLTHSSRTKKRQEDSSSFPVEMRSSSRPGVPTTMSTCQQQSTRTEHSGISSKAAFTTVIRLRSASIWLRFDYNNSY